MTKLRFSVWEQSTQRYDAYFEEQEYREYVAWLHTRAADDNGYNHDFAVEACKVFDTLTFADIVAIMNGDRNDIEFPSGWGDHDTSVYECIMDWVNEYIYDEVPEYLDSEQIDSGVEVVED